MDYYELNDYQKAIFDMEQKYSGLGICNIGGVMVYNTDIDFDVMKKAVLHFVNVNAALRMCVGKDGRLYFPEYTLTDIDIFDCSDMSCEQIQTELKKWFSVPFEFYDSVLFEYRFFILPDNKCMGGLKMHHILGDAESFLLQFGQLEKYYIQMQNGCIPPENEDTRYIDSMLPPKVNEMLFERAKEYFSKIRDYVNTDMYRYSDCRAERQTAVIEGAEYEQLKETCARYNVSIIALFYSALAVYMKRCGGSAKQVFGVLQSNRSYKDYDVVGMYANTLPLMIQVNDDESIAALAERISADLLRLMRFGRYPVQRIISDNGIKSRLYDISVSYMSKRFVPDLKMGRNIEVFNGCSDVPMRFYVNEYDDKIEFTLQYICQLFDREYAECFPERILGIMRQAHDGKRICDIEILSESDIEIYKKFNDTQTAENLPTVSEMLFEYAKENPNKTAIYGIGNNFTYSETENMSNFIACELIKRGVKKGDTVALVMGKSEYLPIAMMAVIKSGAAFMPILPTLPKNVLNEYVSECKEVITLSEYGTDGIKADKLCYRVTQNTDLSEAGAVAYCMKTSGSTGKPKTVMIANKSLSLRLNWMHRNYGLDKVILQKTIPSFDVSLWELLSNAFGSTLVILPDGYEKLPDRISEYINRFKVQTVHFVPSVLAVFLDYIAANAIEFTHLEQVFSSGEKLYAVTADKFYGCMKNAVLHNLYGPTECTIDVTYHRCTAGEGDIPIGKPADNTKIYIVNAENRILPIGQTGEILVTGDLVGVGYKSENQGGYIEYDGKKAYKTGDCGYIGFDGELHYTGRKDNQVKINGIRIDLSESERTVLSADGVIWAKAAVQNGRLILYYSAKSPIENISGVLSENIPADRLPSSVIFVEKVPVLDNGKTDVKALRGIKTHTAEYAAPTTQTERKLCDVILRQLRSEGADIEKIGIDDNLFELGIDSVSVIAVTLELNKIGIDIGFQSFYRCMTVREIAKEQNVSRPFEYLKKCSNENVLICFPYAGGQPQCFLRFADDTEGFDVISVNYEYFADDCTLESIAEYFADIAKKYRHIRVIGCCVGGAYAAETVRRIEQKNADVEKLFIIASLPSRTFKIRNWVYNPWRCMPKRIANSVLSRFAGQKTVLDGKYFGQFKIDTDRFFEYMYKAVPEKINADTVLVYSEYDSFTKGYAKKYKRWKKYITSDLKIAECKCKTHYFIEREHICRDIWNL